MVGIDTLYSIQQQPQQMQNDSESQQQQQQRRQTSHPRRVHKHLLLLPILAILAIYNMELGNNELGPARERRRTQSGHYSNENDPGRRMEVDFSMVNATSRAFITLTGVENRAPTHPEIFHLENALWYILNNGMNKHSNRRVQIATVDIPLNSYAMNYAGGQMGGGGDAGGGGEEEDEDVEVEEEEENNGPKFVSQMLNTEDNMDNTAPLTISIQESRFGGAKRRISDSNYELHVEALITTRSTASDTKAVNKLLELTINENSVYLIRELQAGEDLNTEQLGILEYFNDLKDVGCSSVGYDAHPDTEDKATAQTLPPRAAPTPVPTPEIRQFVASNPQSSESKDGNGGSGENVENEESNFVPTQPISQSIEDESNAFERYNTVSASIFVVTLIVLGFWNIVRVNRKQIERRRKKVELAKVAYQAPLSMTNGLMDVGMAGRGGIVSSGAAAYDTSNLDEDRYVGTMDKTTGPPS